MNDLSEVQPQSLAATYNFHSAVISTDEEIARKSIQKERVSIQVDSLSTASLATSRTSNVYDFHLAKIEELSTRFNTSVEKGLTSIQAEDKLRDDGPNTLVVKSYKWILDLIGYYFGGICLLLWPAVVLCILAYQPFGAPNPDPTNLGLAGVIVVVIIIQGTFSLFQEYSSSKVMKSINAMLPQQATVIRDGKEVSVPVVDLVVGDIVKIEIGNRVPADLRLVQVQNVKLDTSMLTGESEPITCTIQSTDDIYMQTRNLAFMGCGVVEGVGYGMVVSTGNRTVMGKIAKLASGTSKGTSTLRKEALRMVIIIAIIAIATGILLLIYWAAYLRTKYPNFMSASAMISTVIGLIVAFVPEGFPLALALTLTFIARKMRSLNVLVKKLSTVETLGSVSVIASDKTGTLTQNKMFVSELFVGLQAITARASISVYESNDESLSEMIKCLTLCNRAFYKEENSTSDIEKMDVISGDDHKKVIVGDASDTAFLNYCVEFVNVSSVRVRHAKLAEIPFNSKNKYMLTIVRQDAEHSLLYMKGAAEIILKRCANVMLSNGTQIPVTEDIYNSINGQIETLAKQGKRVLAAAKLELSSAFPPTFAFDTDDINFPMENLTFVGLVALMDPHREDVPSAIETLKKAGIRVAMVTGDHPSTAVCIARNIGIIGKTSPVINLTANEDQKELESDGEKTSALSITGEHVAAFSAERWDVIVKEYKEVVFARTTPEQKLLIVREFQRRGCIVAATGDGTNDAAAMKQANVGICMGAGTDMAKEAADIILLDNRFSSITIGVQYGRLAFDNLRKIVTYVLPAGNWAEMIPIFLSAFMGIPIPLSAFLMIIICVGTDVAPALSLVTEPTEGDIMTRKPRVETKEKLVDVGLFLRAFLFLGSIECVGALLMFFIYFYWFAGLAPLDIFFAFDMWADGFHGYTLTELNEFLYTAQSIYFISLVMMQVGQLLTTRLARYNFYQQWLWKNPNLFLGILIEVALAVAIIYLPLFNQLFKTRAPPVQFWFMPLVFSIIVFVSNEILKGIMRVVRNVIKQDKAVL